MAVVAHDENSGLALRKVIFKPGNGVEVKVVGGLVEKEIVGIAEEGFGKKHTYLVLRGHIFH